MSIDPLIAEALQVVEADPDGHLPLGLRRRIRRRAPRGVGGPASTDQAPDPERDERPSGAASSQQLLDGAT